MIESYFIGWDVGAWHCDRGASRDSLVALHASGDDQPEVVGNTWRGNLRKTINAEQGPALVMALLQCCGLPEPGRDTHLVLGIDTPLGWPDAFHDLLAGNTLPSLPERKRDNRLLNRRTDLRLWDKGFEPLSPVQDLIGSQSTKGLHVLRRAGFMCRAVGVWSRDLGTGREATAIECYPTPCRASRTTKALFDRLVEAGVMKAARQARAKQDAEDALQCAIVAYLFQVDRTCLDAPLPEVSEQEGWIWVPKDCFEGQKEIA